MNQVLFAMAAEWSGAGEVAGDVFPRPPPNCPTITIDVGILFGAPDVVNERLLVSWIAKPPAAPVGTVITTGDQPVAVGFNAAHVAVEPLTAVPQKYPHIGTVEPSAMVTLVGATLKLIVCWPKAATAAKGRIPSIRTAAFSLFLKLLVRMVFSYPPSVRLVDFKFTGIYQQHH